MVCSGLTHLFARSSYPPRWRQSPWQFDRARMLAEGRIYSIPLFFPWYRAVVPNLFGAMDGLGGASSMRGGACHT